MYAYKGRFRLRQHDTVVSSSGNVAHCATSPEKDGPIPPCRRRIGPWVQAHAWFGTDRVSPVSNTSYAVTNLKGNFASGRAEQTRSFSRNSGSKSQNFVKKIDHVPCCRRRFCRSPGETPGLNTHRVSPVSNGQRTPTRGVLVAHSYHSDFQTATIRPTTKLTKNHAGTRMAASWMRARV